MWPQGWQPGAHGTDPTVPTTAATGHGVHGQPQQELVPDMVQMFGQNDPATYSIEDLNMFNNFAE